MVLFSVRKLRDFRNYMPNKGGATMKKKGRVLSREHGPVKIVMALILDQHQNGCKNIRKFLILYQTTCPSSAILSVAVLQELDVGPYTGKPHRRLSFNKIDIQLIIADCLWPFLYLYSWIVSPQLKMLHIYISLKVKTDYRIRVVHKGNVMHSTHRPSHRKAAHKICIARMRNTQLYICMFQHVYVSAASWVACTPINSLAVWVDVISEKG